VLFTLRLLHPRLERLLRLKERVRYLDALAEIGTTEACPPPHPTPTPTRAHTHTCNTHMHARAARLHAFAHAHPPRVSALHSPHLL
jgi:hypothetical protein